jgi:hypothetical protein
MSFAICVRMATQREGGVSTMVIVVLIAAPQAREAALEKTETLNARSVAEALRGDLGKAVVPELRRIRETVNERSAAEGLTILAYPSGTIGRS